MPALLGSGLRFRVVVTVDNIPVTFQAGFWQYEGPVASSVSPNMVDPTLSLVTLVTLAGDNFGFVPSLVTVGGVSVPIVSWNNTVVSFMAPFGVSAVAPVVVTSSSSLTTSTVLRYMAPVVTSMSSNASDTSGGGVLLVGGRHLALPLGAVSVWLVRDSAAPSPPWESTPYRVLHCHGAGGGSGVDGVACTVPQGTGVGWSLVLVNHERAPNGKAVLCFFAHSVTAHAK